MNGRGFWIWRLDKCENGNIDRLIAKCKLADISFVAVKCGNSGSQWKQFNKQLVDKFHSNNIKIYGWSYDIPSKINEQVKVVKSIEEMGADGYIIDAEIEWDKNQKAKAIEYMKELRRNTNFIIADAPWDVPQFHTGFPFAEFSVDVRSPQAYHVAHGISVEKTLERYKKSYGCNISSQVPSASVWTKCSFDDIEYFEKYIKNEGCSGYIMWAWDSCTSEVWRYLLNSKF